MPLNTNEKKAVFFDIDGTLVDSTNTVPASAREAIRQLRANGHLAFINTGRTYVSINEHIRSVGFDGYICACGSRIYCNGTEIFTRTIDPARYAGIIRILRRIKAPVFFEGPDRIYFDPHNPGTNEQLRLCRPDFVKKSDGRVYDMPADPKDPSILFDKFFCLFEPGADIRELQDFVKDDYLSILHSDGHFEVTALGCSKAQGVHILAQKLGLSLENCYAVGDSANDLEMLKAVAHGIAMGDSAKVILPYCEFITKPLQQDGILHALKHYSLI